MKPFTVRLHPKHILPICSIAFLATLPAVTLAEPIALSVSKSIHAKSDNQLQPLYRVSSPLNLLRSNQSRIAHQGIVPLALGGGQYDPNAIFRFNVNLSLSDSGLSLGANQLLK